MVDSATLKIGILSAAIIIVGVVIALTCVAIFRDGPDETIIVGALVGLPTLLITSAGPLIGHYLGQATADKNAQTVASITATAQTNTPSPTA